jgi:hypothetical protein
MEADIRPLEPDEPVSRVGRTGVRITTDSQTARARSARSTPPTRSLSTRRERTRSPPRESDDMTVSRRSVNSSEKPEG